MKHVIQFSGGVGSWAAARRVADDHGIDDMVLLFADTYIEDDDLYRFIIEAAANISGRRIEVVTPSLPPLQDDEARKGAIDAFFDQHAAAVPILTRIVDGRDPWQVFEDVKMIGNPRIDPCSRVLKRQLLDRWRNKNCKATIDKFYIGIDWSEEHRLTRLQDRVSPWMYYAPMCDAPYLSKPQMISELKRFNIAPPSLYADGFPHNNCGGFCVKAGQAQFELLLRTRPDQYQYHEQREQDLRNQLGDYAILRDRRGGTTKPMTLRVFRERLQREPDLFDNHEWGACGCAID